MFDFKAARDHMVESQIRTADVTDYNVVRAFRQVPRELFVPKSQQALAYAESVITTDEDRHFLRPRDLSKLIQAADIQPTDVVLDIACGRGYSTAILSHLAETVVGLEDTDEAVELATKNLMSAGISNAAIVKGALRGGASEHGPFNVILVNGAVSDIPKTWTDQLAQNGRLAVITKDGPVGRACLFTRSGDSLGEHVIFDAHAPFLPGMQREPVFSL